LAAAQELKEDIGGCTVIGVGKLATVDGLVITSHADCCSECRVQIDAKNEATPRAKARGVASFDS